MAHVEALDAQRCLGQRQCLLELVQRSGPAVVVGGPLHAVAHEFFVGVSGHCLQQGAFVTPLRDADGDRPLPFAGQPPGQQGPTLRVVGHQHLPGDPSWWIVSVVSGQHLGYQLPPLQVFGPVDDEALSPHHSTPSYVEHLGGGL